MGLFDRGKGGDKKAKPEPERKCELIRSSGWRSLVSPTHFILTATAVATGGMIVVTVRIDRKTGDYTTQAHWRDDPKAKHAPSEVPCLNKTIKIRVTTGGRKRDKTLSF